jgi:hypothetical protein
MEIMRYRDQHGFLKRTGNPPAGGGRVLSTRRKRLLICALFGLAGLLMLFCGIAPAEDVKTSDPNKVKAAFIRNFAHYVNWPTNAFAGEHAPWRVGILGDDPFGDVMEKALEGRKEQERAFEIVRADTVDGLPPCQIVFIAYGSAAKRRAALAALKDSPVLTVGDAPDFLQEGGIIRFQVRERVEMSINLDQARAASLRIQSKMLEVSREVLENGAVRKLR